MMNMAMLFVVISLSLLKPIIGFGGDLVSVRYSYSGLTGPKFWGILSPNYTKCATGRSQSPINIVKNATVVNPNLRALDIQYHDSVNATLFSNGYSVEVDYNGDGGVMVFNGKNYSLRQMHWHTPSDHKVDATQFPAELHLVHLAADNSTAVISILFQFGQPDTFINDIRQQLDALPTRPPNQNPPEIELGIINIQQLRELTNTTQYYTYNGSLTAPPCTEGVTWIVLGKVGTIANDQVEALRRPLDNGSKNNARPVQPLSGRSVQLYNA